MTLVVRPIGLRAANAFVDTHHRHNGAARGHKFSISIWDGPAMLGVFIAGRPVNRNLDDGDTIEVTRGCALEDRPRLANGHVDGACSLGYGRIWRAAVAMGYTRGVTYTQAGESGSSLRAAGWLPVAELAARKGWAESSVAMVALRDPVGTGGVPRIRWERYV